MRAKSFSLYYAPLNECYIVGGRLRYDENFRTSILCIRICAVYVHRPSVLHSFLEFIFFFVLLPITFVFIAKRGQIIKYVFERIQPKCWKLASKLNGRDRNKCEQTDRPTRLPENKEMLIWYGFASHSRCTKSLLPRLRRIHFIRFRSPFFDVIHPNAVLRLPDRCFILGQGIHTHRTPSPPRIRTGERAKRTQTQTGLGICGSERNACFACIHEKKMIKSKLLCMCFFQGGDAVCSTQNTYHYTNNNNNGQQFY